jgi:Gas vesicle synthesis protein GvpL/GvpF
MIWLYALTDNPTAGLPEVAGHGARPLSQTSTSQLAGIWSTWSPDRPSVSNQEALWRQEAVLEALMRDRAVLPLRYGTVLEGVDELLSMMIGRQEEWRRALDRVRGCVELGVRASVRPPPAAVPASSSATESGTEYLRRRGVEHERAQAVAGAVHAPLAAVASTSDTNLGAGAPPLFAASYLVPDPELDRFKRVLSRLTVDHPELAIVCTGPWPPYSFVDDGALGP